jgi:hypothetical protein
MKKIKVKVDYKGVGKDTTMNLILFHFTDENNIHFIHSPHLDLTGYGKTKHEANESFKYSMAEFLEYTHKEGTLEVLLENYGWTLKEKNEEGFRIPDLKNVLSKSDYVSEIFEKYDVNSFHRNYQIVN